MTSPRIRRCIDCGKPLKAGTLCDGCAEKLEKDTRLTGEVGL